MYKIAINLNKHVKNINDLNKEEIKNIAINTVKTNIKKYNLINEDKVNTKIESLFDEIVESIVTNTIAIPRVIVQQTLDIN